MRSFLMLTFATVMFLNVTACGDAQRPGSESVVNEQPATAEPAKAEPAKTSESEGKFDVVYEPKKIVDFKKCVRAKIAFVYVHSSSCGNCPPYDPLVHKLLPFAKRKHVRLVDLKQEHLISQNIPKEERDAGYDLLDSIDGRAVPSMVVFRDGVPVGKILTDEPTQAEAVLKKAEEMSEEEVAKAREYHETVVAEITKKNRS